ncbi:MAG: hypothetical protein ACOCXX_00275 [Planctomycetota bacterium]
MSTRIRPIWVVLLTLALLPLATPVNAGGDRGNRGKKDREKKERDKKPRTRSVKCTVKSYDPDTGELVVEAKHRGKVKKATLSVPRGAAIYHDKTEYDGSALAEGARVKVYVECDEDGKVTTTVARVRLYDKPKKAARREGDDDGERAEKKDREREGDRDRKKDRERERDRVKNKDRDGDRGGKHPEEKHRKRDGEGDRGGEHPEEKDKPRDSDEG